MMSERFVVKDGVVTDAKTGLQWEAEHHGTMTWDEAMKYAKSLRLGGHDDWRVPTVEELLTLVDYSRFEPASLFPDMLRIWFWSSTAYSGSSSNAWPLVFNYGYTARDGVFHVEKHFVTPRTSRGLCRRPML